MLRLLGTVSTLCFSSFACITVGRGAREETELLVDVPMDLSARVPLVQVTIGRSGPLNFVLDTGFDVSILDAQAAEELGLVASGTTAVAQPGGAVEMGSLAPVDLCLGEFAVHDLQLISAPLRPLSGVLGRRFDGILGHDVLARFVVDIDSPARRLRLFASEEWRAPPGASALEVRIVDAQPLVQGSLTTLDGREVSGWFKLDTGSLDVAGLNLNFVEEHSVLADGQEELDLGGIAVGGGTEGRLFRARALQLGAHREEAPLLGYTTDSAGFEVREDAGTIGAAVLARHRLVLDYARERVWFVGPVAPAFPEDRSGLLLVSPDLDGLEVARVVAEGPAAEAGLRTGDRILAIDGRMDLSLGEARLLLCSAGPVEIEYRRGNDQGRVLLVRRTLLPLP